MVHMAQSLVGEGLVEGGHVPANSGFFFDDVYLETGVGQVEAGLHPGDAPADDHYRADGFTVPVERRGEIIFHTSTFIR